MGWGFFASRKPYTKQASKWKAKGIFDLIRSSNPFLGRQAGFWLPLELHGCHAGSPSMRRKTIPYSAFNLVCEGHRAFNLTLAEYKLMTSQQLDPVGLSFLRGRFIGKTSADKGSFRQLVISLHEAKMKHISKRSSQGNSTLPHLLSCPVTFFLHSPCFAEIFDCWTSNLSLALWDQTGTWRECIHFLDAALSNCIKGSVSSVCASAGVEQV